LLGGHVENVASIYNSCHCHVTATGSEGFFLPGLEMMASGLINIAPNYSGHLDYMNNKNSLLVDSYLRYAKPLEQYWGSSSKAKIGQINKKHMIETMRLVVEKYEECKEKFAEPMRKTVELFSWERAAQMMLDAAEGNMEHYKPGTFDFKTYKMLK